MTAINEQVSRPTGPVRSILRWAGSKRQVLHRLKPYWSSSFSRYVEPFAGSACLFFSIDASKAVLGDTNQELIGAYRSLRDDPAAVIDHLATIPRGKREYYRQRERDISQLDEPERAARFIYLNRLSFNGIFRTNMLGRFNVPYGGERSGAIPAEGDLMNASRRLKSAKLVAGDFSKTLTGCVSGDFVYLDPPYQTSNRRVFREYTKEGFGPKDLIRLRQTLERLNSIKVAFVVSYADSKEGRDLAKGFHVRRIRVRRNVAGFAGHRRTAYEIIISNVEPAE